MCRGHLHSRGNRRDTLKGQVEPDSQFFSQRFGDSLGCCFPPPFFLCPISLVNFVVFLSFFKDLGVPRREKTFAFFVVSLFFSKKKEQGLEGGHFCELSQHLGERGPRNIHAREMHLPKLTFQIQPQKLDQTIHIAPLQSHLAEEIKERNRVKSLGPF